MIACVDCGWRRSPPARSARAATPAALHQRATPAPPAVEAVVARVGDARRGAGRPPDRLDGQLANAVAHRAAARTPLLQRDLLVSVPKSATPEDPATTAVVTYTDASAASSFFEQQYAAAYEKRGAGADERLRKLAEVAALDNEVVEVELAAALRYIHTGDPLRAERQFRDPSRSPVRGGLTGWEYEMTGSAPGPLDAPQSPRWHFSEEPPAPISFDPAPDLTAMFASIASGRAALPEYQSKFGKNLFRYRIAADIRVRRLRQRSDARGSFYTPSDPVYDRPTVDSRLYQSRLELPPSARGGKPRDYETEIRGELDRIYESGKTRKAFYGGSSLYAHQRAKTPREKERKVDRERGYFLDTARSGPNAISSLYVHSEVQAAAHAHEETGKELARELLRDIVARATLRRRDPAEPIEVVVISVSWSGASEPNTVCGGACKGALAHVGEIIEREFDAVRHHEKDQLAKGGVFVRGSAELSYSGHARGRSKFQGYGDGADERPPSGGKAPRVRHRFVSEYSPMQ